jgi:hypothetical protein
MDSNGFGFYWVKSEKNTPWEIASLGPLGWWVWPGFLITPDLIGPRIPHPDEYDDKGDARARRE